MADAVEEVATLEKRRCDALAAQDLDALRSMFADEYVHCHATALIQTREEMIQHVLANPRSIDPRPLDIRVYGDTAVIAGPLVNRIEGPGGVMLVRVFATQVAHKFPDGWKFVSFQATRVPD